MMKSLQSFPHIRKICLAHLPTKTNVCAKFHDHWSKTEEVVHNARFFIDFFCNKYAISMTKKFPTHPPKIRLAHLPTKTIGQKLRKEFAPQGFATDRPPVD